jgi:hypothetical protein
MGFVAQEGDLPREDGGLAGRERGTGCVKKMERGGNGGEGGRAGIRGGGMCSGEDKVEWESPRRNATRVQWEQRRGVHTSAPTLSGVTPSRCMRRSMVRRCSGRRTASTEHASVGSVSAVVGDGDVEWERRLDLTKTMDAPALAQSGVLAVAV